MTIIRAASAFTISGDGASGKTAGAVCADAGCIAVSEVDRSKDRQGTNVGQGSVAAGFAVNPPAPLKYDLGVNTILLPLKDTAGFRALYTIIGTKDRMLRK